MSSRVGELSRVVLATFTAAGVATLWVIAVAPSMEAILNRFVGRGEYEYVQVHRDSVIVTKVHYRPAGRTITTYRFADGRPANDATTWSQDEWRVAAWLRGPFDDDQSFVPLRWDRRLVRFFISQDQPRAPRWYLVHDGHLNGHAYFVGYDYGTNDLLGFLGQAGFSAVQPPIEQQFTIDGRGLQLPLLHGVMVSGMNSGHEDVASRRFDQADLSPASVYLLSEGRVWHIDLQRRTVGILGQLSDVASVDLAPMNKQSEDKPGAIQEKLLVRTDSEILKVELDGSPVARWALPTELRNKNIGFYDLGDGKILASYVRRAIGRSVENEFLWLGDRGDIEKRQTVETLQGGLERHEVWSITAALPMPAVLTFIFCATAGEVRGPDYPSEFAKTLALFWPGLLLVHLASALLAALAYRRHVRFALPVAAVWAVFVFLLGAPGWLAYRWHRRWPVLETCGECRQPAPRDRETCAACGQLFAPPPLLGTEIFA